MSGKQEQIYRDPAVTFLSVSGADILYAEIHVHKWTVQQKTDRSVKVDEARSDKLGSRISGCIADRSVRDCNRGQAFPLSLYGRFGSGRMVSKVSVMAEVFCSQY